MLVGRAVPDRRGPCCIVKRKGFRFSVVLANENGEAESLPLHRKNRLRAPPFHLTHVIHLIDNRRQSAFLR